MENLSHSRRPNGTAALPSKTGCNNGGGKSLYDDVFGGQPRFGVPPTLSPRAEDYAEIFGGFHAPRATSIPVLDLPLVGGGSGEGTDDDEVFFDARSGSGFDYGEVFGGYNAPDFAVSFEDLMTAMSTEQSDDGRRGDSSDEAWSPADAESLSDGSDHSAKDPCMSNGDSYDSIDGTTEFNISYNKASLTSNGEMPNGITNVTQVHPVPGYTVVVDKTTSLPEEDGVCAWFRESDDGPLDINFSGEMMKGRHLRKTMSQLANGSSDRLYFGNDVGRHGIYSRSSSLPNETFVTISDVSLKTQPSQLPPPSRPPPPLDVRKGGSSKSSPNSNSVASEGMGEDDLPTYFDIEVDGSSSAAASAAAMKEAMEKAQVKLSYVKDMMERKREGSSSRRKMGLKNGRKDEEKMSTKIADGSDTAKLEPVLRTHQREQHNGMEFPVLIVNPKVAGKPHLNSGEEKHGRDSVSSCGSDKEGAGEWEEATQYYELVRANKSRKAFDHVNGANIVLQDAKTCEVGKKGKGADMDALWQHHHENGQNFKTSRADHEMERYVNVSEVSKTGCDWVVDNGRSETVKMAQKQNGLGKKGHAASEASRWEEEKFRTRNQPLEAGNKQIRADFLQKDESMVEVQQKESKSGNRQTMKDKEKEAHLKESNYIRDNGITSTGGREGSEKTEKDALELEENGERLGATFEQQEKETRTKPAIGHEEKEESIRHLEQEESERRQKNALERDDDEKRLRETLELEENEKRQKEALEKPENERRIKGTLEKEENDRRKREALECKEDDRRQREICEGEENQKKLKDSLEKEEDERKQREGIKLEETEWVKREAWERKENEKRLREALEQEENEKKLKGVLISEKNEKMHAQSPEKEFPEEKINGVLQREEIGNRLDEECLKEGKDEMFRVTWAEVRETGVRETSEPEEARGLSQEACKQTAAKFDDIGDTEEEVEGLEKIGEVHMESNQAFKVHSDKSLEAVGLHSQHDSNKLEQTKETAREETKRIPTELRNDEKVASVEVDRKAEVSGLAKDKMDHGNNRSVKGVVESGEAGHAVWQRNMEKVKSLSSMDSAIEKQGKKYAAERGDRGSNIKQAQCTLNHEDNRDTCMADKVVKESFDAGRKEAAAAGRKMELNQPTTEVKASIERTAQQINACQGMERIVKNLKENLPSEEKEAERIKRERQMELERLQKIEDEREREREREKDRISVDRITLDARERAYAEGRERVERAAVERATTESRQRALNEARERLEKACAEAREKSLSDRTSMDARLRAERAAVERATAEARERAFERAMAERAASAPRNGGMRPSPASSDLQGQQPQNAGSANGSRHPYSSAYNSSYYAERSAGVEGESAERCKARLERHRRTAERAAKALAEKNMRDLLAQREQAERNRLAETLDADVKRWSSGKEGNLRALLSTLQYILGPDSGWQPIPLTEVITSAAVKKAYRKATLCVHPDKLQQRGASIQQKYVCEKVFDLLKEAWNKFNSEER